MRPYLIAGNWKMNTTIPDARQLAEGIRAETGDLSGGGVGVLLCPPFTQLTAVRAAIEGSGIHLGAQNMHQEAKGAYTGEISSSMLLAAGCSHVILGHSERRRYFGESDELINAKAHAALDAGLLPVICIGETLEEREQGITREVVERQVRGVLSGIPAASMDAVTLAYEPVWAIGTGRTATPDQAQEVHAAIRALLGTLYDAETAAGVVLQYGGSMNADNSAELLTKPDVDGGLIGGASLKVGDFVSIVNAARDAADRA
jgi:triosephosphate isomerase